MYYEEEKIMIMTLVISQVQDPNQLNQKTHASDPSSELLLLSVSGPDSRAIFFMESFTELLVSLPSVRTCNRLQWLGTDIAGVAMCYPEVSLTS